MQTAYYHQNAVAITPNDTPTLNLSGFYVGGTGDVAVITPNGNTVTFKACPVSFKIDLACTAIKATGTTATLIVGLLPV